MYLLSIDFFKRKDTLGTTNDVQFLLEALKTHLPPKNALKIILYPKASHVFNCTSPKSLRNVHCHLPTFTYLGAFLQLAYILGDDSSSRSSALHNNQIHVVSFVNQSPFREMYTTKLCWEQYLVAFILIRRRRSSR